MGHSQFEKIPISRERQERLLQEQIDEITEGIAEVKYSGGERFTVKQLERTKKSPGSPAGEIARPREPQGRCGNIRAVGCGPPVRR